MKDFIRHLLKGILICFIYFIALTFAGMVWKDVEVITQIKLAGSYIIMFGTLIVAIALAVKKK